MSKDRDYKKLINSTRWIKLRRTILSRQPLCEYCRKNGVITSAVEVHHKVPVESGVSLAEKERLAYSPLNLVGLCHMCHIEAHKAMRKGSKEVLKKRNESKLNNFIQHYINDGDG